jgi:hypothetical protein
LEEWAKGRRGKPGPGRGRTAARADARCPAAGPPPRAPQASGGALAAHAGRLATAAEVRENLARAAHALAAARAVLRQCLAAGQLVSQQQLYHALCSLDVIRRKHLGAKGRGVHLI